MIEFALAENFGSELDFSEPVWIEALPARNYQTPMYGEVSVPVDKLERMVTGFKKNVRGQDIAINYDHGMDKAKGNKAAGWYRDFAIGPSSIDGSPTLRALVQFTDQAAKEIKDGEWKYFSMEWDDLWMDNAGNKHPDVVIGGAITNRPVAKHMQALPVNFSESQWKELDEETQKKFAVWSQKYQDSLPDSSFLHVETESPAEDKGEGAESKSEKRHLPYKDANGKIDLGHLRNAISRLSQPATGTGANDWLDEPTRKTLLAKARSILAANNKKMSEEVIQAIEEGSVVLTDESADWEHSEPGTGPTPRTNPSVTDPGTGQPVPQVPGNPADDPAIGGGWRRDPQPWPPDVDPNSRKDEALTDEEIKQLKLALGLDETADAKTLITTATTTFSEAGTARVLREQVDAVDEEKRFAEKFPTMHKQMMEDRADGREARATKFSESVSRIKRQEGEKKVKSDKGLSALALDTIKEVHKKFAEGVGGLADYEEAINVIVDGGIVDFSEVGSSGTEEVLEFSTATPEGIANARKLFAEKVAEVQLEDKLDYSAAIAEAAKRFPDLASAYNTSIPA